MILKTYVCNIIWIRMFCFDRYGLLGPSGCGKSTILQCILGKISLDLGSIDLTVETLRDVGYMPQVNFYIIIISGFDIRVSGFGLGQNF